MIRHTCECHYYADITRHISTTGAWQKSFQRMNKCKMHDLPHIDAAFRRYGHLKLLHIYVSRRHAAMRRLIREQNTRARAVLFFPRKMQFPHRHFFDAIARHFA